MQSYEGGAKELESVMRGDLPLADIGGDAALAAGALAACVVIFVLGRSTG
jgi:hypothetical protein